MLQTFLGKRRWLLKGGGCLIMLRRLLSGRRCTSATGLGCSHEEGPALLLQLLLCAEQELDAARCKSPRQVAVEVCDEV